MIRSLVLLAGCLALPAADSLADPLANPRIDIDGFLAISQEAARYRESRRVSEAEFLRLAAEPGTIILDARSRAMYDLRHIRGAINLSFPDLSIPDLERTLPDKSARILIACNNNFTGDPVAFAGKRMEVPLNIPTYITLYAYGYRNVYELGPLLDVATTRIPLVSSGDSPNAPAAHSRP